MSYSLDKIGLGIAALAVVTTLTLTSGEIAREGDSLADVLVERAWAAEPEGLAVRPPFVEIVSWDEDLVLRRPALDRPRRDAKRTDGQQVTAEGVSARDAIARIDESSLPPRVRLDEAVLRRPALVPVKATHAASGQE